MSEQKPYPSDASDDEWAFVAPYLTLRRKASDTAADEQDRAQVGQLAQEVQEVTGQTVEVAGLYRRSRRASCR